MRLVSELHGCHAIPIDGIAGIYKGGVPAKIVSRMYGGEVRACERFDEWDVHVIVVVGILGKVNARKHGTEDDGGEVGKHHFERSSNLEGIGTNAVEIAGRVCVFCYADQGTAK